MKHFKTEHTYAEITTNFKICVCGRSFPADGSMLARHVDVHKERRDWGRLD